MEDALKIIRNKTALVINGGGTLGISEIGALQALVNLGLPLSNFTSVTGSSVGSIIATAIAGGASIEYILDKMSLVDLPTLKNEKCIVVDGVRLIRKYGLHSMEEVNNFIGEILSDLVKNSDITFLELYNLTKVHLTVTYLSMNYQRTIYADYINEPDSLVRTAVVKSSAIPLFYEGHFEQKEVKHMAVDGGTQLNYPMIVPRNQGIAPGKILGLKLITLTSEKNVLDHGQPGTKEEDIGAPENIIDYLTRLVSILRNQAMKVHVSEKDWMLSVKIDVGALKSTDFDLTPLQKEWLFDQGEKAIKSYLKELTSLIQEGKYPY